MALDRYRYFWQRPRTHREILTERRVSFLELFYDLIYVVLIARVAVILHDDVTVEAVLAFGVLFSLVWIGWYNGSLLHDAHGRADVRNRLFTFLQMFAIAAMAVFAPDAAGPGGQGFAICYTAFLAILVWQWIVVARLERTDAVYGPITRRYTTSMVIMTGWIGASIFVDDERRVWMWAAFVAAFVFGMVLFAFSDRGDERDAQAAAPLATESLLERFALFMIIVLGEVVASVVAGLGEVANLSAEVLLTGFAGLAVAMAFWWTYFDLLAMRAPRRTTHARYLYNLMQLPLCLALTGVGAATVSLVSSSAEEVTPTATAWLFSGFVALAMVCSAAVMRLLEDYRSLSVVYRPAARSSLLISALALVLAAVDPAPLVLALVPFAAMAVQWALAVRRWLETPEGVAKTLELGATE